MVIPFWMNVPHHHGDAVWWQNITEAEYRSRISEPGYMEQLLPHTEWLFDTIKAVVALIDHDTFPATKTGVQTAITPTAWAKFTINDAVYKLLIIREFHRTKKQFDVSDSIRQRLIGMGVAVHDAESDAPTLLHPVWGRYVYWELPPFEYSGRWLRNAAEIYKEKYPEPVESPAFMDGDGI